MSQIAWEAAMGMRGYAGSPAQRESKKLIKLIRVHPGLYRSERGGVVIIRIPGLACPWEAKWQPFIGEPQRRQFRTLAEARRAVS